MQWSTTNTSELRKNLGEALDWVSESKMPLCVQKRVAGGTRDTVILPVDVLDKLLDRVRLVLHYQRESDGSYTVFCDQLGLEAMGQTPEMAIDEMLAAMVDYAHDYFANIKLYLHAPNSSGHYIEVLKIFNTDENQLRQAIDLVERAQ